MELDLPEQLTEHGDVFTYIYQLTVIKVMKDPDEQSSEKRHKVKSEGHPVCL